MSGVTAIPRYKRQGFDSIQERRQYKRFERGTRSDKQRSWAGDYDAPTEQAVYIGDEAAEAIIPFYAALDRLAGAESKYERDGQQPYRYALGDTLCTKLHGEAVKVVDRWNVFGRIRYKIEFAGGETIKLTQAQLVAVLDAPERCVEKVVEYPVGKGTIRCDSGSYSWYTEWCESKATS